MGNHGVPVAVSEGFNGGGQPLQRAPACLPLIHVHAPHELMGTRQHGPSVRLGRLHTLRCTFKLTPRLGRPAVCHAARNDGREASVCPRSQVAKDRVSGDGAGLGAAAPAATRPQCRQQETEECAEGQRAQAVHVLQRRSRLLHCRLNGRRGEQACRGVQSHRRGGRGRHQNRLVTLLHPAGHELHGGGRDKHG